MIHMVYAGSFGRLAIVFGQSLGIISHEHRLRFGTKHTTAYVTPRNAKNERNRILLLRPGQRNVMYLERGSGP